MFCPNCGTQLDDSMRFCPECGERIAPSPAPAQQAQNPEQPLRSTFAASAQQTQNSEQTVRSTFAAPAQPVQSTFEPPVPPVQNPEQPAQRTFEPPAEPYAEPAPKKPKKKLGLIIGIAAALVVVAAAVLLIVLLEQNRVKRYNEGVTLLEENRYSEAEEIFSDLGSYADSEDLYAYAKRGTAYEKALAAMKRGNYREAYNTFAADPDFRDARKYGNECQARLDLADAEALYGQGEYENALAILNEMYKIDTEGLLTAETDALSENCRNRILFKEAKALYESGDYAQAYRIFEDNALDDIEGAAEIRNECKRQVGYQTIVDLMNNGGFREALDLLNSETGEGMPDRDERLTECRNRVTYEDADQALKSGHNYDAYVGFRSLGSFEDAAERAKKCIVTTPRTGETYHNGNYKSSSVTLTITPPSDGTNNYLKLYAMDNGKETLVACAFFRSGERVTLKIPAGSYRIKIAYSSGDWFGETDMFGDNGTYQRLKIDGADTFKLTKGSWTLTLRQKVSNGNVGTTSENRNNF
ncbi:MAG: zinc-ribbon domain-containing protein [Clostridia bacterium]|nr:zinc-ribbon domain-containing protein [Clostridia bacterium]